MSEIEHRPIAATSLEHHSAGSRIPAHLHDDGQLIYVSAGVIAISTPFGTWSATPQQAVLIPPRVWHEHRLFGRSIVHTIGGLPTSDDTVQAPVILRVDPLCRELMVALSAGGITAELAEDAVSLLHRLLRRAEHAGIHLPAAEDPRLREACRIAEAHLGENVPLADLAGRVGVSERALSRLFRTEFQMTFPQWRTSVRVFHASVALAEGDTVTATAVRLGWSTPSAFITNFARLTGQTPAVYRRAMHR